MLLASQAMNFFQRAKAWLLLWWSRRGLGRRHRRNIRRAERVLAMIRSWVRDESLAPRVLGYLRKIDPYVFEEVVMCAIRDAGGIVERNRGYSGDGGIDGRFTLGQDGRGGESGFLKAHVYAMQAKRYAASVSTLHVTEFARLVIDGHFAGGVFAHTGRTPSGARAAVAAAPGVAVLSGHVLIGLLIGERRIADLVRPVRSQNRLPTSPTGRPGLLGAPRAARGSVDSHPFPAAPRRAAAGAAIGHASKRALRLSAPSPGNINRIEAVSEVIDREADSREHHNG